MLGGGGKCVPELTDICSNPARPCPPIKSTCGSVSGLNHHQNTTDFHIKTAARRMRNPNGETRIKVHEERPRRRERKRTTRARSRWFTVFPCSSASLWLEFCIEISRVFSVVVGVENENDGFRGFFINIMVGLGNIINSWEAIIESNWEKNLITEQPPTSRFPPHKYYKVQRENSYCVVFLAKTKGKS